MSRYGLIGAAYKSESPSADAETLINWYVESMESRGARNWATIYQRPGMYKFSFMGDTPIRGMLEINGRVFVAAGSNLCELFSDGTNVTVGSIGLSDDSPVSMVASPQTVLVIAQGVPYALELSEGSFVEVTSLKNAEGNYSLDWPISRLNIVDNAVSGVTVSETGNTVSIVADLHSLFGNAGFLESLTGMSIILSGFGVSGYNGTWVTTSINANNLSAVVIEFTNPTSGLGPSSGNIEFGVVQIESNIGVGLNTPQAITVAGTSHSAFNTTYTLTYAQSNLPSSTAVFYYGIPPAALIGDATVVTDGSLSIDGYTPSQCEFCDGYFLITYANSQYWRTSNLFNAYNWDALDIARVQVFTGNIRSMIVDHRTLWFFDRDGHAQGYYDSGDSDFPFTPIEAAFIEQGSEATFCPIRLDNTVFFMGRDGNGALIAWRMNGYLPQRVSTHAVENIWQSYSETGDIESWSYQWHGHMFWVLYFPTEDTTWVYDVSNGLWHQQLYWNGSEYSALKARCHVYAFGMHLVGDPGDYYVYALSSTVYEDFGNAIRLERRAPAISNENQWIRHVQVQVDLESGIGNLPDITSAAHYSDPTLSFAASTGGSFPRGQYQVRIVGTQGGVFQGSTSDAAIVILGAQTLQVDFPGTISGGNWRLYISGDGWQTAYYHDFGDTIGSTIISEYPPLGWAPGVPTDTTSPVMHIRWSNDNTHTWSSDHAVKCPNFGDYTARGPMLQPLGAARKRIYEISCTDPVPWRIIDGYVITQGAR